MRAARQSRLLARPDHPLKDMNVFSLLKRLGGFRRDSTDDISAAFQPTRTDFAAHADDRSDTTDFTPASWPAGERKRRQLQSQWTSWGSDI